MAGPVFNPLIPLEYLLLLGTATVFVVGALAWRANSRYGRGKRWVVTGLRVCAAALIVLLAANPGTWQRADRDSRHEAVILVDRSASMATRDVVGRERWAVAASLAAAIQAKQSRELPVIVHAFSRDLEDFDPSSLRPPDGSATDMVGAGRAVLDRYRGSGRHLQGILIIGDGRQTGVREAADLAEHARAMDCPISAVVLGGEVKEPDLDLQVDRRQYIVLPGQKLTVTCTVSNTHLPNISPRLRLLDSRGREIRGIQPQLAATGPHTVRFEMPELPAGYHTFHISAPIWDGERRTDNNTGSFAVLVPERKMRVFVAEGVPSWDTKFFLQLLRRLEFISVLSVSRVTSERFFEVSGTADRFQDSPQPVFPDTREAMAGYDLILIGKGAEYFLTRERVELLKDYLREQGGCILFFRGQPNQTPLPELEALEPVRWTGRAARAVHLLPTRWAEDLGLFGDILPGSTDELWRSLPAIRGSRPRAVPKDFATVLMVAEAEDKTPGTEPVLVSRRYGKGQVLTMNADGLWQWDFFPVTEKAQAIYATLWTQVLQWTVSAADFLPGQTWALRLSQSLVRTDQPVHVTVTSRTEAAAGQAVVLRVFRGNEPVQAHALRLPGGPVPTAGTSLLLSEPGDHRIELFDPSGDRSLGPCRTVSVRAAPDENTTHNANPQFLGELARLSGGNLWPTAAAGDGWLATLHERRATVGIEQAHRVFWQPWWNIWQMLAIIGALLCVEWFMRKRSGLL